jgi:hypothetical protein
MTKRQKKLAKSAAKAGKKVLATEAAQSVIATVADKLEELPGDKTDTVAKTLKKKASNAAKAAGRKPAKAKKSAAKKSGSKKAA